MIPVTPDPIAFELGPLRVGWYGIGYVVAIAVMVLVSQRELERRGIDKRHFFDAMLFVGALALVGARLYHVIDQWHYYSQNLLAIVLPPYSGLALYGGIAGAALGILIYARRRNLSARLGLDAVIPGTFFAQAIARWGNFFNQELYGPPTDVPWGIAIDCAHRVALYPCSAFPLETTGFHPLFFYESALNVIGGLVALYLSRRHLRSLRPGDLAALWLVWYGAVRALLETFREGYNWTLGTLPVAQLLGVGLAIIGIAWIAWNHRAGGPPADEPVAEPAPPGPEPPAAVEPAADAGVRQERAAD